MNYITKYVNVLILFLPYSLLAQDQTFSEFLGELPTIDIPKTFNEASYFNWQGKELPSTLTTEQSSKDYQAVAQIELDENYPLVLIRKSYNNGHDFFIRLLSFDADGNYINSFSVEYTADGEGMDFSITPERQIRLARYVMTNVSITTYNYNEGEFIQVGDLEFMDEEEQGEY